LTKIGGATLAIFLAAAEQELEKPARKSFVEEIRILERALRKALSERDEVLRELATPARWSIDQHLEKRRVLGRPTHQALRKALEKASAFV
jgi:hypothetical protein